MNKIVKLICVSILAIPLAGCVPTHQEASQNDAAIKVNKSAVKYVQKAENATKYNTVHYFNSKNKYDTTAKPIFKNGKPMNLTAMTSPANIKTGDIHINDAFGINYHYLKQPNGKAINYMYSGTGEFSYRPLLIHLELEHNTGTKTTEKEFKSNIHGNYLKKSSSWQPFPFASFNAADLILPQKIFSYKRAKISSDENGGVVEANWNKNDLKGLGKELVTKYNIYYCNPQYRKFMKHMELINVRGTEVVDFKENKIQTINVTYTLAWRGHCAETKQIELRNIVVNNN